jgi:CheY-like chemotaxis protein
VASDARLLERILLNFVGNAVRYTETGRIVIGCRRRGALAEIMVVDTGIGIAEEELPHVFREFHQVGEAGGHRSQGLGLGLAIVDRLARLLGHEVRARSQPQRGSSFGVLVPVTSPRLEVAGAGAAAAPEAVSLAGLRVLVVDDDPAARAALAGLLDRWECLVDEADVGVAALDAARRQVPGAVVCDLRLHGGESGFDVLDALRAQCAPSPVAFLITGDYSQEHVAEASRRGYPILAKPVPPARLRALLEQLLRERAGS